MAVTRRSLVVVLAASPFAAVPAAAQVAAPVDDKLQKAAAAIRDTSAKLTQIVVPIELEPAFRFEP